ncbi:asparaginase [Phyllobacterium sp. 0TCS1.6C]|uniref:asparaginase n=1 Tax=unclassified Phyllobacterium TaxID=2638441 RepID=UPI002264C021|nr:MULTISPECIES: asparaginase [unclassified Phyllobacterium]MCX8281320.1 asparaginase [Phyllobacterium sp. 0TCS1.6C]MCX8296024.1 asparaginase [Phyllobacterium sp. 0TCS1.6A]
MMSNPVLVEVFRGETVESLHRGAVAVVDGDGRLVFSLGDIERPVFPRSAIKAIQALPLVESGAADAYGFGNEELAMACASHSGEPLHVAKAEQMLRQAGLDASALECGTHWPFEQAVTIELARSGGQPTPLHNNCSGKHAGFLCTCQHLGLEKKGYSALGSPEQDLVRDAMEGVTGAPHALDQCGTDGCSIPTYAIPLRNLAHGFARMASGVGLEAERRKAARRLVDAAMAAPFYVAGTGRACTRLMEMAPGRIFVKTGAEGVFTGALPELGLGIAVKCDDGATRAAEAIIATVLGRIFRAEDELESKLDRFADREMRNWNGITYGVVSPTEVLTEALIG